MPDLWLALPAIICGFAGLVWSADKFIEGSAAIAWSFGVSPLVVGLTVVSLGTSAPEVVVSISASLREAGELAVGNAIGSNLANMGLVLGVTALVARLPVQKHILRHELPILLLVTLLGGLLLLDGTLTALEGTVLLATLLPALMYLVWVKKREMSTHELVEEQSRVVPMSRPRALMWFAIGLLLLIASSEVLVWGAKTTALAFGVSPLIIGLTLIALGTSLPELAASIISARRGLHDIALGNIVGSNMFNLMAVMSLPGILGTPELDRLVFTRDYLAMGGMTFLLAAGIGWQFVKRRPKHKPGLGWQFGVVLLLLYAAYYVALFSTAGAAPRATASTPPPIATVGYA